MNSIVITPKIYSSSIYFIFRPNGQEVLVNVYGHHPVADHKLTVKEIKYINDNIM